MKRDSKAAGHGHVQSVLEVRTALRHVAGHRACGIKLRGTPLDEDAAIRIGDVARPELVRIAQETEVHVSAA